MISKYRVDKGVGLQIKGLCDFMGNEYYLKRNLKRNNGHWLVQYTNKKPYIFLLINKLNMTQRQINEQPTNCLRDKKLFGSANISKKGA